MTDASILTIILNFRTPDLTLKAAGAALRAMEGLRGEVLIVDNGSGDGSFRAIVQAAKARGWIGGGRLRVVESGRNGGFGAGMNFAIRCGLSTGAAPDFYYLLNSDAVPEPDAIRHLRDFLLEHPRAGIAGSHVHGVDGTPHQTAFRFPTIAGEFEGAAHTGAITRLLARSVVTMPNPEHASPVEWTAGVSLLLRRAMLERIGGFDETFFLYFEETDLCLRAARAGWETHYLPHSTVAHVGSASTGAQKWARTPTYWFDSRLHYFVKNHGAFYAAMATLAWVTGGILWKTRQVLTGKPNRNPRGFMTDMIAHDLRALFRRPAAPTHLANPLAEDRR
ncbi:MAG: glycosyltransferase family 2 protein [Jhaorihella sp.]